MRRSGGCGSCFPEVIRFMRLLLLLPVILLVITGCARTDARKAYREGCTALTEGKAAEAEKKFEKVVSADRYLAEGYRGLGIAYMTQGEYPEACIAFEKSLLNAERKDADFTRDVRLYLAYCRENNGQEDKALKIYNDLLARSRDRDVLYLRGRYYLNSGQFRKAERDFDEAIADSDDFELYVNIYQCYAALDKSADGSKYLEEALKIEDKSKSARYHKGLVEYYLKNYEGARDILIEAINKDSTDKKSMLLLGQVYLAMNDAADARAVYDSYTDKEDAAASAYNGMALCDIYEGSYDSALQNIEKGLQYKDDEARQGLLFNQIVVYENMKDWDKARQAAASYVAAYPTDEAGQKENKFLNRSPSDASSDSASEAEVSADSTAPPSDSSESF